MASVSLKWCPTPELRNWIETHWHYLPESIAENKHQEWCETMHELLLEMDERTIKVSLDFDVTD